MKNQNKISAILKFIVLLIVVALLFVLGRETGIADKINVSSIQDWVNGFGVWAPIAYVAAYVLGSVIFLPGTIFTLAAGVLFGTLQGFFLVLIAATLGATVSFVITRFFGTSFVTKIVEKKFQSVFKLNKRLATRGFATVLFLRLIPLFPFNGLNFALGLTRVRIRDYILATFVGIMPGSFVLVYLGESAAALSPIKIAIALALFVVLLVIINIVKRFSSMHEENEFDIIVIGAGSGGLGMASFMNTAGFKVLLVETSDHNIGGDCLNYGCIPSKAFIHITQGIRTGKSVSKFGVDQQGQPDIKKIMHYVREKQGVVREKENASYLRKKGIHVELGFATFSGDKSVKVNDKEFIGKRIVIATGSRPRRLDIPGVEKVDVFNNESIFSIDYLPKKLLVIGGGPIGVEMAQAFRNLGSEVSILQRADRLTEKEAPDISDVLEQQFTKSGIKVLTGHQLKSFSSSNKAVIIDNNDKTSEVEFDAVFVAIGRTINIDKLEIEKAGIVAKDGKLVIDDYLRTTNKRVYAVGDAAGRHMFSHAAELHVRTVAHNFFSPFKKKLNVDHFSWVTFTDPEIATFGLNEDELKKRDIAFEVLEKTFQEDDRAIVDEYRDALVRLYVGKKQEILGGTMIAPGAGEIIQELILANTAGITAKELFEKIYPYPTAGRINQKTLQPLFSSKLTPRNKKILRLLYG